MIAAKVAPWLYMCVLLWVCGCLFVGQRTKRIDLWTTITVTKGGKEYVDPKKLAYVGAFVLMSITFAFWGMIDRLTEWYAALYVGAWVAGKWFGDREQRLQQQQPKEVPKT